MNDPHQRQKQKNITLFIVLLALVALFYAITIMKMGLSS